MRLHLSLLAASLVLCALHAGRQLRSASERPTLYAGAAIEGSSYAVSRAAGPTINWGGQKR